jgi:Spy/CpxP family protein refolding chaperone
MNIVTRRLLAFGVAGSFLLGGAGLALAQNEGASPDKPAARRGQRGNRMQALNLTPEQQQKLKALREEFHKNYLEILTPEQREKLQSMRRNRAGMGRRGTQGRRGQMGRTARRGMNPQALEKLNLTEDQKTQVQAARAELREAMKAARAQGAQGEDRKAALREARGNFRSALQSILTPEQQEQLKSERQNSRRGRFGRNGRTAPAAS